MKIYKTKSIEQQIVTDIKCDCCNKIYDKEDLETEEMISIFHACGYLSIFGDEEEIDIDICQYCFKKIVEKFKIELYL